MAMTLSAQHHHHIKLWYLVQHSISTFRKLVQHFGSAEYAVNTANLEKWKMLNVHLSHQKRVEKFKTTSGQQQFLQCLEQVEQHSDFVLIDTDEHYPQQLLPYPDRPPILFGKGQWQSLNQPQVAIVGSRNPSQHGKQVAYDFSYYLSDKGFYIVSGLAQGIDEAAHLGALQHHRTIAVVGTGLDQVYPPQNKSLEAKILQHSGCILSEFLPETKALQHHFPRRNRIVSGLSLAVLVAEAALKSGSLITAKSAADQGKITFAIPGHIYSDCHQGCHQLIREGAILVDHPEQMVEDLALPTQWQAQQRALNFDHTEQTHSEVHADADLIQSEPLNSKKSQPRPEQDLPEHLIKLYQQLDWVGQDIDQLTLKLNVSVSELMAYLVELELVGLCTQQFGLYLRCRASH